MMIFSSHETVNHSKDDDVDSLPSTLFPLQPTSRVYLIRGAFCMLPALEKIVVDALLCI